LSVFISDQVCFSDYVRCRRFRAITAIFAALCLRPPARDPTPYRPLLKTNAKVEFDRTVTERSKFVFRVFRRSNQVHFLACFFVFTVRSAEGRKRPKVRGATTAAPQIVILNERSNLKHQFQFEAEGRNPERKPKGKDPNWCSPSFTLPSTGAQP
jgi:hypothetical protein